MYSKQCTTCGESDGLYLDYEHSLANRAEIFCLYCDAKQVVTHTATEIVCHKKQMEHGYWSVNWTRRSKLGPVVGSFQALTWERLQEMIEHQEQNFPSTQWEEAFWWPPVENHILEFEQMARCLDAFSI